MGTAKEPLAANDRVDGSQLVEAATPLWEFLAYAACVYVIGERQFMLFAVCCRGPMQHFGLRSATCS